MQRFFYNLIPKFNLKKSNAGLTKIARKNPEETRTFHGPIACSFGKKEEGLFLFTAANLNPRPFQTLGSA